MNTRFRRHEASTAVLLGPAPRAAGRASLFRNTLRCFLMTLVCAGDMPDASAVADPATAESRPPQAEAGAAVRLEQAVSAFALARQWLSAFDPPRMDAAESRVALDAATAVHVILRRHGRLMGAGSDDAGDDLMLRRALGRAMNEALSDPALQSVSSALKRSAGAGSTDEAEGRPDAASDAEAEARLAALRRDLGRSMTLELEVAGPRTPLVGATIEALARKIDPGIEGVSLRRAQAWAHAFPSQLRAANLGSEADKTLTTLAIDAGIPMAQVNHIPSMPDAGFYAFQTIDLLQSKPEEAPERLHRGERLIATAEITRGRMEVLAAGLAQHLLNRRFPEPPANQARLPLGFMGDYSPVSDQFSPPIAPPLEQALCALSLIRYAQLPGAEPDLARSAAAAARQALRDLAEQMPHEEAPTADLQACAVMIMAACDMPSCLGDSHIAAMMLDAQTSLTEAFDPAGDPSAPMTPMLRAMTASAWARMAKAKEQRLPAPSLESIRLAIDGAWDAAPGPQRIALLPWIGWAERDYANVAGVPLSRVNDLGQLADALERTQVVEQPGAPADLIGGLALTGAGEAGGMPRPTAQSVRPAAWLAANAVEPLLTPADQQPARWERHRASMRFVCQLTVSELRGAAFRNPARCVGGICASPWDSRQPVAAQAMGLLAAVETLRHWPETA